jgi:hypothetical protein
VRLTIPVPFVTCMVNRNIGERIHSGRIVFGISNYSVGKNTVKDEVHMHSDSMVCPCCRMQLRLKQSSRRCCYGLIADNVVSACIGANDGC